MAHLERSGHSLTVKDHQVVYLHPSSGLLEKTGRTGRPEWVVYHEFVLTSRNYIRVVIEVKDDWLLDIAPHYFDLDNYPPGDAKQALERVAMRRKWESGRKELGAKRGRDEEGDTQRRASRFDQV